MHRRDPGQASPQLRHGKPLTESELNCPWRGPLQSGALLLSVRETGADDEGQVDWGFTPCTKQGHNWGEELLEEWLGIEDSNLGYLIQSQASYR